MRRAILLSALLVQTYNGTVSVVKDLDPRTCKIAACHLQMRATCLLSTCDDEGNQIYPSHQPGQQLGCSFNMSASTPVRVECIE